MTKVSVVIPTYNRAGLVGKTLQSVLKQTFTDYEVIVVDDGSSDNTRQVIESFRDPRVRYLHQANQGVCVARNNGVKHCHGSYVAFLDSDDLLLESSLEKGAQTLDAYPQVAFTYGQAYLVDEAGRRIGLSRAKHQHPGVHRGMQEVRSLLVDGNYIPASSVMIRMDCLQDMGPFDLAFKGGSEDYDLWVRLARKHDVAYLAAPMIEYLVHSSSITGGRKLREIEASHRAIFESVLNDGSIGPVLFPKPSRAYFYLYLTLARYAWRIKEDAAAKEYLGKALSMDRRGVFNIRWLHCLAMVRLIDPVSARLRAATSGSR
jgi:glycosyltransferase involved in cell wall biosynthesis